MEKYNNICLKFDSQVDSNNPNITIIKVYIVNIDNINEKFTIKEDLSFKLTITKGIGSYFSNEFIDFNCVLYENDSKLTEFKPSKTGEKLFENNEIIAKDKIEITIKILKGTSNNNPITLKLITSISKIEDRLKSEYNILSFDQIKQNVIDMNYSGNAIINMEISNAMNCKLMRFDYKIENIINLDISNPQYSKWPMITDVECGYCFKYIDFESDPETYVEQRLDKEFINFLVDKKIYSNTGQFKSVYKFDLATKPGYYANVEIFAVDEYFYGKFFNAAIREPNYPLNKVLYTTLVLEGDQTWQYIKNIAAYVYIDYYNSNGVQIKNLTEILELAYWYTKIYITREMINTESIIDGNSIYKKVKVDSRTYFRGEKIPILVEFNRIMDGTKRADSKQCKLVVNNKDLYPYLSAGLYSSALLFLYEVTSDSPTELVISSFDDGKIFNGDKLYNVNITTIPSCILVPIRISDAIISLENPVKVVRDGDKERIDITVNILNDSKYKLYYTNDYKDNDTQAQISNSVYAVIIDKNTNDIIANEIPLKYSIGDTKCVLEGSYTLNVNIKAEVKEYIVKLYARDAYMNGDNKEYTLYNIIYNKTATFSLLPIKYVEAKYITLQIPLQGQEWPSQIENVIYNVNEDLVQIGYVYDPINKADFATAKDFLWSIENKDISKATIPATIVAIGDKSYIQPCVNSKAEEGEIIVKLTATNRNVNSLANVTIPSQPIKIIYEDKPTLIIPSVFSKVEIIDGEDAKIRYIQNLTEVDTLKDVDFYCYIYNGYYRINELENIQPIEIFNYKVNSNMQDKNEFTISNKYLKFGPSKANTPKYTALIKSKDPYEKNKDLYAIAHIYVIAKQIKINLNCGDKTTYIDNSDNPNNKTIINIDWEIENIDEVNGAEVLFKIDKNGQVLQDSIRYLDDMINQSNGRYIGSYDLELLDVSPNLLKDVYTVYIEGKNTLYKEYSYNSKMFNVYSASSLKILINNEDRKTYDMNNQSYVNQLSLNNLSSQEIEKLRKELSLKASANIKSSTFKEYEDLVSWKTSDKEKLTINYFNGVNYQDIQKTIYKYFPPSQQFTLSGLKDGVVTLTVTHAQTNLQDEVTINISTLKDKFYLFKFYPQVRTTINYTDSKNNNRTVTSNDEGMLALYEPNGINSSVYVKSELNSELYLGTILKINLLSGEKDATKSMLYPINMLNLRKVAVIDIYLKNDNGTPFTKKVKIHGGVYKNDGYCQDALIGTKTGKEGIELQADYSGRIRINMDATQFWSRELGEEEFIELSSQDKLKFILEIYPSDENYYPVIINIDGNENTDDIVKFGNGVVNLVKIKDNKKNTPFMLSQNVSYPNSNKKAIKTTDNVTKVGPSSTQPKVNLNTDIMMWGVPLDVISQYELGCRDKQGKGKISQSSSILRYPFSKSAIIRNSIDLSEEKIWINNLEQTAVEFILNNNDMIVKSIQNQVKIVNMCNVEAAHKSKEVQDQLEKLKNSSAINATSIDIEDKLIKQGIKILSAIGMQGQFLKMALTSTQDPSIYRVFIWAGNTDVGLNIPDNLSIVLLDELESSGIKCIPEISDLLSMGNGKYEQEQEQTLNNIINSSKKSFSKTDYSLGLGGYFLAEVEFDYDITKWGFCILGGGFSATASMEYKWTYNSMVGPVPITAYIKAGGGVGANFNIAVRRSQLYGYPWDVNYPSKKANDYITRINANIYIRAFAGIGFDVAVIALRIGIFGQVEANFETAFLSRDYLSDYNKRELNGQYLQIKGTIGIEFEAKFLFISYSKVLASVSASKDFKFNQYDQINNYWTDNSALLELGNYNSENNRLEVISSSRIIETRNYLDKYERYWLNQSNISKLANDDLFILEYNSYPNSQPKLSNDGYILVYLSDQNSSNISDTRLCYSIRNDQGSYNQGTVIPPSINSDQTTFDGFGDCNPKIDGNKDFAALTWIRLIEDINLSQGSNISNYEELYMLHTTEIMLSIWQNNLWNTIRVTKDTSPDLSPVVATNGDSVFLAWRNVYSNNEENILDFSVKDNIDFIRISKDNLVINETYNLYNGSNGSIKGLDVAMLKNGTCCVAYAVDLSKINKENEYEIFYSIINTNNEVVKVVRLTRDEYLNENPKVSTVTLKSGEEKFVIAYHTSKVSDENILSDIRLTFVDKDGILDTNMLEAISEKIGAENIELSGKYEFVKVDKKDNQIENLALIWTEAYLSIDESTNHNVDKDMIKVIKFVEDSSANITLSAPINICVMPDRTLIENFDSYMSDIDNLRINTILIGTEYEKIDLNDPSTYKIVMYKEKSEDEEMPVYISDFISNLYMLDSNLNNSITIESMYVDYVTVKANMQVTVLFALKNNGLDVINNIQIDIDNKIYNFENLDLGPNYRIEIPVIYELGEEINNVAVVITAKTVFNEIITENTTLYLDYPDVGISKVENISEVNGIRKVRVTLYNETDCKLAKPNRSVILEVHDEENKTPQHQLIINNLQELESIDGGYYTTVFDFNIKEYLGEGVEIPSTGVGIYIDVKIHETVNNKTYVLPEINMNNNSMYYNFESLLNKYKENISISVDHEIVLNKSVGYISIRNNSLSKQYGRLLAKLLDENNNLIESKVFDMDEDLNTFNINSTTNDNLLANEEEELSKTIIFDTKGKTITVEYYNDDIKVDPDVNETRISTSYDFNEVPSKIRVDIELEGAGMDNEDPIIGDTRWEPFTYKVIKEDKIGVYECYEYKTDMYLCKSYDNIISKLSPEYYGKVYVNSIGKYIVYVTLKEEMYTTSGWKFQDRFETIKYEFIVENK